jgi:hypothetical protein
LCQPKDIAPDAIQALPFGVLFMPISAFKVAISSNFGLDDMVDRINLRSCGLFERMTTRFETVHGSARTFSVVSDRRPRADISPFGLKKTRMCHRTGMGNELLLGLEVDLPTRSVLRARHPMNCIKRIFDFCVYSRRAPRNVIESK